MRVGGERAFVDGVSGVVKWALSIDSAIAGESTSCSGAWPIVSRGVVDWNVEIISLFPPNAVPGDIVKFIGTDTRGNGWAADSAMIGRVQTRWRRSGRLPLYSEIRIDGVGSISRCVCSLPDTARVRATSVDKPAIVNGVEINRIAEWSVTFIPDRRNSPSWSSCSGPWPRRERPSWWVKIALTCIGEIDNALLGLFDTPGSVELYCSDNSAYIIEPVLAIGMAGLYPDIEIPERWTKMELTAVLTGGAGRVRLPTGRVVTMP